MGWLPDRSVDVVVTSPPYNIGKDYGIYDDTLPRQDYLDWCVDWGRRISKVLRPEGSFFLNVGAPLSNPYLPFDILGAFRGAGLFELQNTIHWIKSITIDAGDEVISRGHFKPVNSPRYLNDCHEHVFHLTANGSVRLDRLAIGVPYADKSNVRRWQHTGGNDMRCRGNTWFIPYKTIHQRARQRPHPATFPTALAEKCIRLHGGKNLVVMDPFLGIGHSAFAARECSDMVSKFIGFDIDREYLKVATQILGCKMLSLKESEKVLEAY